MLFPGRKIEVVDSNVKGTTGPIPGSQGYISDFYGDLGKGYWVDFRNIVWFKYGKNGKLRVEKGLLLVVSKTEFEQQAGLKNVGRRIGHIKFPEEKQNYKDFELPTLEFLSWAGSLLRLPMSLADEKYINLRLYEEFGMAGGNPRRCTRQLPQVPVPWNDFHTRGILVSICRHARTAHYRYKQLTVKKAIARCETRIAKAIENAKKYKNIDYTPAEFVKAVNAGDISMPTRYLEFCSPFNMDAILMPRMEYLLRDSSEWIKALAKDWAERCEKFK